LDKISQGKPADRQLAKILRSRKELGARDRRMVSNLAFAVFRWRGWTRMWENSDRERMFLASLILEGKADSTVAEEWARTVKPRGNWRQQGENRSLAEKSHLIGETLGPANHVRRPQDLFPDWFFDELPRVHDDVRKENVFLEELLRTLQTRPPIWIRFQEENAQGLLRELQNEGLAVRPCTSLNTAASIHSKINMNTVACYRRGQFEIQDLASQAVALVCAPRAPQAWWDVCAGGGGKSLHLAALMQGRGEVWASDVRDPSLAEVRRRAKKCGLKNIVTQFLKQGPQGLKCKSDGTSGKKQFDGVLVDAPCSGTGTWRRNPDARWRVHPDDIGRWSKRQGGLLNDCSGRLRPGGMLIYSVCSITRTETVQVVDAFLKSHPEFTLAPTRHPLTNELTRGMFWIWPQTANSDAMFIARFQKAGR